MSIKLIIAGVVAAAAVGGGTYFVVNNTSSNDASQSARQTEQTKEQEKSTLSKASLNELLARGDNLECSFNYTDDSNNKTDGTFYISKERMRGDFTYNPGEGRTTEYGMIRKSTNVFTWDKAKKEGFKLDVSDYEEEAEKTQEELKQQAIDQSKEYDFDCNDWNVDESKFETPEGVKFTDLSAQLEKIQQRTQEATQGAQEQLQNACSQIADPEVRAACEKNLQ